MASVAGRKDAELKYHNLRILDSIMAWRFSILYIFLLFVFGCAPRATNPEGIPLGTSLRDNDPEVRRLTVQVLAETENPRSVGALIACLADEDPGVRSEALVALRRITSEDFGMDYVAWITWHQTHLAARTEGPPSRTAEIPGPSRSSESEAPPGETALPEGSDPAMRDRLLDCPASRDAVRTWIDFGEAAVPALLTCLEDPNPHVRKSAIQSLAMTGRRDASQAVCRILQGDQDSDVRAKAAGALGLLGGDCAQESLIQGLQDPSEQVRFYAVTALRWVGDSNAVWPLIRRLEDPDVRVQSRACMVLKHLTGQELPQDPVPWQDWYGRKASLEAEGQEPPLEKSSFGEEGSR